MSDQPPVPKHHCNVTFLSVGDMGPDGLPIERLLRCSRCMETYYCGKEQQKSHWKIHKNFCKPASQDYGAGFVRDFTLYDVALRFTALYFNSLGIDGPQFDLNGMVESHGTGRLFRHLFERLEILCSDGLMNGPHEENCENGHHIVLGMASLTKADDRTIELLWAFPGMTDYILNLELVSDAMSQRKSMCALPTTEELEFQGCDPSFQIACPFFAMAVTGFLMNSIFKTSEDPSHGSGLAFRGTPLASFAARKMMQWYADPYTRVSIATCISRFQISDARFNPRSVLFGLAMEVLLSTLPDDPLDEAAVVPGLTAQDIIQIMTTEPSWKFSFHSEVTYQAVIDLMRSASEKTLAWQAFPIEARASAAHKIVDLLLSLDRDALEAEQDCTALLLLLVLGCNMSTGAKDDVVWLKVVTLASTKKSATGIDFPFGPHVDYFSNSYQEAFESASSLADTLVDMFLEGRTGFMDLLPPTAVMNHIIEYAIDPFPDVSSSHPPVNLFTICV